MKKFSSKNVEPVIISDRHRSETENRERTIVSANRTYTSGRFSFEINGILIAGVHTVEEIESESEIIEYKEGDDAVQHFRPGPSKTNRVKVSKNLTNTSEFFAWRKAILDGKVDRKSVSIVFQNAAGEETSRYNFHECWPIRYNVNGFGSRNYAQVTENIEIQFETMEFKFKSG